MYSLVIVDDEPAIRRGLAKHIPWESMGFQVAETFEDGEDALAWLETHHVDVVLTDIRMSVVGGLSVARSIQERGVPTEVVLLSGYREFEYARSAMQLGVRYYLVKPSREQDVREVFDAIRARLEAGTRPGASAVMRRMLTETRHSLLRRLVEGLAVDTSEVIEGWRRALLPPITDAVSVSYALIRLPVSGKRRESVFRVFEQHLELLHVDEPTRCTIALTEPPDLLHFLLVASSGAGIVSSEDATAVCRDVAAAHIQGARTMLDEVLESRRIAGPEDLLRLSLRGSAPGQHLRALRIAALVEELRAAGPEDVEACMERVRGAVTGLSGPLRTIRHAAIDLVSAFVAADRRCNPDRVGHVVAYEVVFSCISAAEVCKWTCETLRRFLVQPPAERGTRSGRIAERARTCIHSSLGDQLSLESIARELYLSPAYLSRLFRQESGRTFIEYVTETRIDRAIALFTERPELSVTDVAQRVGYHDPKYFSRVFRSHVGKTPAEYRRALAQS